MCYSRALPVGWQTDVAADGQPSVTTLVGTSPTRALFLGSPEAKAPRCVGSVALPGIPRRYLASFDLDIPFVE
eukprot:9191791-Pyramimonas_sp.AAC.1